MANSRTVRIEEELKRALAEIFFSEIKDPRISEMATITKVKVTPDLKYAKVYVSIYDEEEKRSATINALTKAEGFVRAKVNERIKLRRIPVMQFILDNSIEYGIKMSKLIDEVTAGIVDEDETDHS